MKPHKWAKEIKAWADGAEIEARSVNNQSNEWFLNSVPLWSNENFEFRIKPQPKEPQYLDVVLLTNGNIKLGIYGEFMPLEKGQFVDTTIGKIKLETEDE